ncbi:glycosyltransferase [Patescibacteria group bacterium]|nr:glycosyltransferase [Patescibacteria group bacterium]MCG2695995.1 glycosyltransferase [Candidatus Portnoybacteria bacterium]
MKKNLEKYKKIVGEEIVEKIYKKAKKLLKKNIVCISSTNQEGGVAEILNSIIFLFNEIGIKFDWRIIHGTPNFFTITKKFHNALQGADIHLSKDKKRIYYETNRKFSMLNHLDHDLVMVHDPQPLPLIDFYKKKQPWIFRCHVDLSNPNLEVWNYLKHFIKKYDELVISTEEYKKNLSIPQTVIHPAIDPLSQKNRQVQKKTIKKYLSKNGIDFKKPIISQISRYDKWKDMEGVIKIFERVKKEIDCQLVLLGNIAPDDPEGIDIYTEIVRKFGNRKDIKILVNVSANDLVVNCLQRKSAVIIQKSLKEGFALTVSEALYKETPVVASSVGGIPLQIIHGENGFLHEPNDINGFAESIVTLLKDDKLRKKMGKSGREHIKKNFLITRLMLDWLDLFEKYLC